MKTKTKTRVLSWIVSICLIAAIIPAIPAEYASAATGATYVYSFKDPTLASNIYLVDGNDITTVNTPLKVTEAVKAPYDSYEEISALNSATAKWYLADASLSLSKTDATKSRITFSNGSFYLVSRASSIGYIDVVVKVEKSAWYNISSDVRQESGSTASTASVAFVGKGISKTAGNTKARETLDFGMHYLNAGDYTVRYTLKGNAGTSGSANESCFYVYDLTLAEEVPEIDASNAYPTAMQIDDTAKLDVTGVTLGADNYDATVEVASSAENVISVGEEGTLTALAAGSSVITVTATYDTDKTATATYVITVREPEAEGVYAYYMTGQMPDDSGLLKDIIGSSFDTLSQSWKLESFTGGTDEVRDSVFTNTNGVGILMRGNDTGTATLKIQVPAEGWYALTASVYESSALATTLYSLNDGAGKVLASCDNIATGNNKNAKADNVVYLKANIDYDFVFHAETGSGASKQTCYLKNIKLTSIPASEIFGDTYAYVKDGTVYFIGGLNTIEGYSEVGFEVTVDGEKADDINTSEVYKSFTVTTSGDPVTRNASDFGTDCEYIFITEKTGLAAGDVVIVKPYIKDATGTKHYHDEDFNLKLTI